MKTSKACVYCGNIKNKFTREHIFPTSINNLIFPNGNLSYIGGIEKYTITEPVIKDVCNSCNNGALSILDQYGKSLCEKYFIDRTENIPITFNYDFNLFSRWLLKVCFNASRGFKTPYQGFSNFTKFILGNSTEHPPMAILAGICQPSTYQNKVYYPNDIDFSLVVINNVNIENLVFAHMFTVRSYSFILLGWNKETSTQEIDAVIEKTLRNYGAIRLLETENSVIIDPLTSKIDHLSKKLNQPHKFPVDLSDDDIEKFRNKLPHLIIQKFNPSELPKPEYINDRTGLGIISVDNNDYAIFALSAIPQLINLHQNEKIENTPHITTTYLIAERRNDKTYIRIPDPYDVLKPLSYDNTGIIQTDEIWTQWKNTATKLGFVVLTTLPKDKEKVRFVGKIKFLIKEES